MELSKKYTSKLYNKVNWRKSGGGRLYKKLINSPTFFGRLYKRTFHAPSYASIDKKILARFKLLKPNSTILDIGGNIGSFDNPKIKELLKKHKYLRLDIDPEAYPDIVGDAMAIQLKTNSVDVVISKSVFEHLTEPWKSINEIHRILKPNGLLYFYTPFFQRIHASPNDYYRFTEEGLKYLLKDFKKVGIYSHGGYVSSFANVIYLITYALDSLIGLGFIIRIILWPIFFLLVKLDRFDKYRLNTLGYFGFAVK